MSKRIIDLTKPQLDASQVACIDLLKEALAEALEGRIFAVGIVACLKGGYATVMAGSRAGDLNLGCDSLKAKIRSAVEDSGARMQQANIIRAPAGSA